MGMLFNSPATLDWVKIVHQAFAKAWPVFTATAASQQNWANLFRTLGSTPTHDTLVRYMALKHPQPALDVKWAAWLNLLDAPPNWSNTIGNWIADGIQDPTCSGVEFHLVPNPYIYATYTNVGDPQGGTYTKNITIYTLTWDGKYP